MFKIMQNRFEAAVKFLCSIAPKKASLAILQTIKISQDNSAIIYEATNLDTFLRINLPCWSDVKGEFAIDARIFAKLSDKVATGISDTKVEFGKVIVPTADVKEFPSLESGFFKNPICTFNQANRLELIEAGKRICKYAGDDSSRGVLEGVCLKPGFLYATNGNFLARFKINLSMKKDQEFVIQKSFFKHLSAEFIIDPTVDITIYQTDVECRYIVAKGRGFELYSKLIVGEYPNVEKILPKEKPYSFTVNRIELYKKIKVASMYTTAEKNFMSEIYASDNNKEFVVKTCPAEGGIDYSDTVPMELKGKINWKGVNFNAKVLSMIFEDCTGKTITLNASENPLQAIVIQPLDTRMYYLLMPLRGSEDVPSTQTDEPSKPKADEKKKKSAKE